MTNTTQSRSRFTGSFGHCSVLLSWQLNVPLSPWWVRPAETLYQVTLSKLVEAYVFCETREWISSECGVFESPIRKSRMMSHSKPVSAEVCNADDSHRADVLWTKNILNQCLVSFCSLPTIILMTIECIQAYILDVMKCQYLWPSNYD